MFKKLLFWLLEKFRKERSNELLFPYKNIDLLKSPKDKRDYTLKTKSVAPNKVRLKGFTVKNQGWLGSCTGHAICTAIEILHFKKYGKKITLSERHNWYHSRKRFGCFPENSGVYNRTALQVAHKVGVSPESLCSYSFDLDVMNKTPSKFADGLGRLFKIKSYYACKDNDAIVNALAQGFPVVIGMMVWKEFLQQIDLVVQTKKRDSPYVGGHSMCLFGYEFLPINHTTMVNFNVVNSWGSYWGQNGLAIIPYSIASNKRCLFEAWAITDIERK